MMRELNLISSIQSLPGDLKLLFANVFLFTFGIGLYNYVWSIYLRQLHANADQVGLVFSIGFIAAALSMIPGGILANRYELKFLLIVSGVMGIPPPLIYYFAQNWTEAIPGVVLLQASLFSIPAFNAYIVGATDKQRITSTFGIIYSGAPLGIVFSPALGSLLLTWFDIRELFLLAAVFLTLSTLVLFPMRPQPSTKKTTKYPPLELPSSRAETTLLVLITGAAVAFSLANPFLPLYFHDSLGISTAQILLLGAVQNLGGALFYIFLGKRVEARGPRRIITLGFLLASSGLSSMVLVPSSVLVFPMVFLFGGTRAPSAVAYSLLSNIDGSRAGKFGFYLTLENLGLVAGSYFGGIIYTHSPTALLLSTSASLILLAILSLLWIRVPKATRKRAEA